jgi:hypothetical protein
MKAVSGIARSVHRRATRWTAEELGQEIFLLHSVQILAGQPGFHSRHGQEILHCFTASRMSLGPTQPPIQWIPRTPRTILPAVKRQGRAANHSPPSSAEVQNSGAIPSLPHTCLWHGVWLIQQTRTENEYSVLERHSQSNPVSSKV